MTRFALGSFAITTGRIKKYKTYVRTPPKRRRARDRRLDRRLRPGPVEHLAAGGEKARLQIAAGGGGACLGRQKSRSEIEYGRLNWLRRGLWINVLPKVGENACPFLWRPDNSICRWREVGPWRTPALHLLLIDCCRSWLGFPAIDVIGCCPMFLPASHSGRVMVPEGTAYAGIVGVPPIMGLYTIVPALLAYALLGSSRQLVVGPDTATGLISAVTVGAIATQGTAEFHSLTSTLAILIGFFFLSFGIMRMGWVASFISTPVMRGFIEGLVYVTIIGQVPHLLGISGASGNFFTKFWHVLQHLPDVSVAPALTGILSLTAMLLFRFLAPRVPAALVVLAVATILIGLLGGEASGVHVVGHIPSGLPHFTPPNLDPTVWYELAPGA